MSYTFWGLYLKVAGTTMFLNCLFHNYEPVKKIGGDSEIGLVPMCSIRGFCFLAVYARAF
jgi:hypothetical protein